MTSTEGMEQQQPRKEAMEENVREEKADHL